MACRELISVIVPVYNIEAYLPKCLETIAKQTYRYLEIILVDDGSTDNSGIICEKYAEKDSRIKYIHQNNEGLSCARNTGIRSASGNYILMVDGDDALHPQMIEILYNLIENGDYDFSMCYGIRVNDMDNISFEEYKATPERKELIELTTESCIKNLYLGKDIEIQYHVVWNKLYKRSLLIDNYFRKLPAQDAYQDVEFNIRVYLRLRKAILLPKGLYLYNQRSMSLSRQGISFRWVSGIITFLYCLNIIPKDQKQLRAYSLRHLYRNINYRLYWSKGTPYYKNALDITNDIKKQTIADFFKNPYIPVKEKVACIIFNHIRLSYSIYLKIASFLFLLNKSNHLSK